MFDLRKEQSARELQTEGVRFVAEYPFVYLDGDEEKPWVFIATDIESQPVNKRFDDLVQQFRKGKHRFGPKKAMGRKEKLSALNLLRLRQQAFAERALHYLEFGFLHGEEIRIFKADHKTPEAFHKAVDALVEMLWTTKVEVISDLLSDVSDAVRETGEEDHDREKD